MNTVQNFADFIASCPKERVKMNFYRVYGYTDRRYNYMELTLSSEKFCIQIQGRHYFDDNPKEIIFNRAYILKYDDTIMNRFWVRIGFAEELPTTFIDSTDSGDNVNHHLYSLIKPCEQRLKEFFATAKTPQVAEAEYKQLQLEALI